MENGDSKPELGSADVRKWKQQTDFIIGKFGLEPSWTVTVRLYPEGFLSSKLGGTTQASTHWPNHYRSAFIDVDESLVSNRRLWTGVLIHEIIHLQTADLHDYLIENGGEILGAHIITLVEKTVSETANIMTRYFEDAYNHRLKDWVN